MRRLGTLAVAALLLLTAGAVRAADTPSYAIYAEYARESNKVMKNGLNRRVFNVVEAQQGQDIRLGDGGVITLEPGTYRLTGFSLTTIQTTFAPPQVQHDTNYPGYCLVYPAALEQQPKQVMQHPLAVGSPQTALDGVPSLFDAIVTFTERTEIALGHQSGEKLNDEVYLSVYEVAGIQSELHVFARIAITRM